MALKKLTDEELTQLKVGDVVYLRGFVSEPDTPGFRGKPSVYFADWEEMKRRHKRFIPEKQAVIDPDRCKGATIFVRTKLLGKPSLIASENKIYKIGEEVFVSFVVTKVHEKEDWDEFDYFRALVKRGTSLDDICTQTFLLTEGDYDVWTA